MSSSSSRQTGSQGGWTSGHLSHCVSLSEGSRGIKSPLDSPPDGRSHQVRGGSQQVRRLTS